MFKIKKSKKFISVALATVIAVSTMSLTSNATENSLKISECGEYHTQIINGEVYIHLNSDNATIVTDEALIAFLEGGNSNTNFIDNTLRSNNSISVLNSTPAQPPSNNSLFDLSKGTRYTSRFTLTTGDKWTPTFITGPKANPTNIAFLYFRMPVIANTTVSMTYYFFTPVDGVWRQQSIRPTFNLIGNTHHILADTVMNTATRVAFRIHRSGTTVDTINPTIYQ
jgi:hypothetical protein